MTADQSTGATPVPMIAQRRPLVRRAEELRTRYYEQRETRAEYAALRADVATRRQPVRPTSKAELNELLLLERYGTTVPEYVNPVHARPVVERHLRAVS